MLKIMFAIVLVAVLAGGALAQTTSTTTSTQSIYTGLEGLIYDGMTPQQQNQYNAIQTYVNFSTQVLNMAYYKSVEKKFQRGETLNPYESTVLSRGPVAITTGNSSFVTVGSSASQ